MSARTTGLGGLRQFCKRDAGCTYLPHCPSEDEDWLGYYDEDDDE